MEFIYGAHAHATLLLTLFFSKHYLHYFAENLPRKTIFIKQLMGTDVHIVVDGHKSDELNNAVKSAYKEGIRLNGVFSDRRQKVNYRNSPGVHILVSLFSIARIAQHPFI